MSPGDWIVSDEDGVVVIPAGRLAETLEAAERLHKVERAIYAEVLRGKDVGTLLKYDELLQSKAAAGGLPQMRFEPRKK